MDEELELVSLYLDSTLVTTNGRPKSRSKRPSYKPELGRVKTTMQDCRLPLLVWGPTTAYWQKEWLVLLPISFRMILWLRRGWVEPREELEWHRRWWI
jgi:hypothetical protein